MIAETDDSGVSYMSPTSPRMIKPRHPKSVLAKNWRSSGYALDGCTYPGGLKTKIIQLRWTRGLLVVHHHQSPFITSITFQHQTPIATECILFPTSGTDAFYFLFQAQMHSISSSRQQMQDIQAFRQVYIRDLNKSSQVKPSSSQVKRLTWLD